MSTTNPPTIPYPSLTALRAAHGELLKAIRETRNLEATIEPVAEFMSRGVVTGALIEHEDDRTTAQSMLDYWSAMIYRSGHEPPDTTLAEFDRDADPELDESLCPYAGLDSFQEEQHDHFFGRSRLTSFLVEKLKNQRMLALLGSIGSGKSSVIRAGLIPALKSGAIDGSAQWRYLTPITPGSDPLAQLAKIVPHEAELNVRLTVEPGLFAAAIGTSGDQPAVLLVDQFDELFTLTADEQAQETFVAALIGLADLPNARHTVLLTMRSDVESSIARFPALQSWFERARVQLLPLGAGELREAIEKPAELIGLKFESGLVDKLIEDLLGEPAALPLLQFTLLELWERRNRNLITWAAYNEVGAGRRALAGVAEQLYKSIDPSEQEMMRRLMLRLVRVERGQDVAIKRVRRDALLQSISPRVQAEQVLGQLIFERLVRVMLGDTTADDQIELAHEALARNWPRLIDWLETERSALETRRRLDARAAEWIQLGRGTAGLLDGIQLGEAESWLASSEAKHLGYDEALPALVAASRAAIEEAQQHAVRQAQALAEEQTRRAEAESRRAEVERERAEAQTLRAEEQAREKRRLGWAFIAIAVMCGIAVILAGYAIQQANFALQQEGAARSESQTRIAQAVELQTAEVQANRSAEEARQKAEQARQSEETAQLARATAEAARTSAETARTEAERRQREAHAGELAALALAYPNQPQIALLLAAGSLQVSLRSGETPLPVAVNTLQTLLKQITGTGYYAHVGAVWAVAYGNNGQTLATAGSDGRVLLWNPANPGAAPTALDAGAPIRSMNIGSDGRYLVTAGEDGASPRLWDLSNTGSTARELSVPATINALASSSNGQRIAIATASGSAWIWDASTTAAARELRTRSPIRTIAVSTDGRWVLTGHDDGIARLWDLRDRDPVNPITTSNRRPALTKVAFSPNGRWVLIGDADGKTHLWQLNASGLSSGPYVMRGQTNTITSIATSPDSSRAATASSDGSTYVWLLETRNDPAPLAVVRGESGAVNDALISQDGQKLITAGQRGTIYVWDLSSKDPGGSARQLIGHDGPVTAITMNGQILASVSEDQSLRLWDLSKPEPSDANLPSDPRELVKLACTIAGRDLSEQEWQSFQVSEPYQPVCNAP